MTAAPIFALDTLIETDEKLSRAKNSHKYDDNPYVPAVRKSRETGKAMQITAPGTHVKEILKWLRDAASKADSGLRTVLPKYDEKKAAPVVIKFQAVEKRRSSGSRQARSKAECAVCHTQVTVTEKGTLRTHGPQDARCEGSGTQQIVTPVAASQSPAESSPAA